MDPFATVTGRIARLPILASKSMAAMSYFSTSVLSSFFPFGGNVVGLRFRRSEKESLNIPDTVPDEDFQLFHAFHALGNETGIDAGSEGGNGPDKFLFVVVLMHIPDNGHVQF